MVVKKKRKAGEKSWKDQPASRSHTAGAIRQPACELVPEAYTLLRRKARKGSEKKRSVWASQRELEIPPPSTWRPKNSFDWD